MNEPQQTKPFPEPVEALIVVLASFFSLIVMVIAVGALSGAKEPIEMIENSRMIYIFGGLVFLLIPLLYARFRQFEMARVFRLKKVPPSILYLSILYGLGLTLVGDELDRLVQMLVQEPEWLSQMLKPLQAQSSSEWVQILLGAVLIAAVAEEFLFRGFLQVALEQKGDVTRAVVLTSIAWTLVHQNPYWAIQIFILGVLIGYVAWRTDSIFPTIIIHGVYNFIGVLFVNLDPLKIIPFYTWRGHVNPVLILAGLSLLVFTIKKMDQVYRS